MPAIRGEAFNIGGGPGNAVSLVELLDLIARLQGDKPQVTFDSWRTGDQAYYVSDTRRSEEHTSELQSLMRISYAVFRLKKTNQNITLLNYSHSCTHGLHS